MSNKTRQSITYVERGFWVHEIIEAAGFELGYDSVFGWWSYNPVEVQAILDSFDPGPLSRADAIKALKAVAKEHIEAKYPLFKQANMARRTGELQDKMMQGITLVPAELAERTSIASASTWIAAVRTSSQAAESRINAEADWAKHIAITETGITNIKAL